MRRGASACAAVVALAVPARADEADDARALAPLAGEVLAGAAGALDAARAAVFPAQSGVAVVVEGAVPQRLAAAFSRALGEALAARGERVVALAPATAEALPAAARDAGAQRVLRVVLARETAGLTATTTALRARASAWETFLRDEPAPVTHPGGATALRVDGALRARFGMPSRAPWPASGVVRPRTIPTPFRDVTALAFGTLGGAPALAVLSTDALRVARVEARSLAFVPGDWPMRALGAVPSPPRQPLGAMVWDASGLRARTSAQPQMGSLAAEGAGLARSWRAQGDAWPVEGDAANPAALGHGPGGEVRVACDGAGGCVVRVNGAPVATIRDAAAPVLVDDLDEDGDAEVVTASASSPDGPDRVRVFALRGGALVELAGIPTAGPVLALAAGDTAAGRTLAVALHDPARGAATLLLAP